MMKNNHRMIMAAVIAALTCCVASPARALTEKEAASITQTIKDAPAAELAVKAAELVTKAAKKEKEATAVAVVRAAIAKSPSSLVTVLTSVIKAAPSVAAAVVAEAVKLSPHEQIETIAAAAVSAAPEQAGSIFNAIVDLQPKETERVAAAIIQAVPKAEVSIQKVVRERSHGTSQANQGESYSSSGTRLDGTLFPATQPVHAYATQGSDPNRP